MPTKAKSGGTYKLYKSYSFREKDPVIDRLRTLVQDQRVTYKKLSQESGVSTGTFYKWFRGSTRRPQFAAVMATVRALGKDLEIVDRGDGTAVTMPSARSLTSALARLPKLRGNDAAASNH